jgi:hypothetical protein
LEHVFRTKLGYPEADLTKASKQHRASSGSAGRALVLIEAKRDGERPLQ